jgi:hypothetical protein
MEPHQVSLLRRERLRKAWRFIRPYLYPVGISFWVALIFAERFVFDERADGQVKSISSALPLSILFVLVPAWLTTALALLASRRTVRLCLGIVGDFVWKIAKRLWSPHFLVFAAVVSLLSTWVGARQVSTSFLQILKAWGGQLRGLLPSNPVLASLSVAAVCFVVLQITSRFLNEKRSTAVETMRELIVSAYFILANGAVYVVVYEKFILADLPTSVLPAALGELVKDTLIYSVIVLAIVVGIFKAEQPLRLFRRPSERGWALVVMALATIICAVPALALDVLFIGNVQAGRSLLYSSPEQQHLIPFHIMFRDFGLIVPLIVAAFLRLFLQIVKLNAESHSRRRKGRSTKPHGSKEMGESTA